jgi:hypothetical protein
MLKKGNKRLQDANTFERIMGILENHELTCYEYFLPPVEDREHPLIDVRIVYCLGNIP